MPNDSYYLYESYGAAGGSLVIISGFAHYPRRLISDPVRRVREAVRRAQRARGRVPWTLRARRARRAALARRWWPTRAARFRASFNQIRHDHLERRARRRAVANVPLRARRRSCRRSERRGPTRRMLVPRGALRGPQGGTCHPESLWTSTSSSQPGAPVPTVLSRAHADRARAHSPLSSFSLRCALSPLRRCACARCSLPCLADRRAFEPFALVPSQIALSASTVRSARVLLRIIR